MSAADIQKHVAELVEEEGYEVRDGVLYGRGRFEGAVPDVLYWNALDMDGMGEVLACQEEDGFYEAAFDVDDDERKAFGLEADIAWAILHVDSQGFISVSYRA